MLFGMLGHRGLSFLKSHGLQQKLPATADTRPPVHMELTQSQVMDFQRFDHFFKKGSAHWIHLNCRYLVMYPWNKTKSHNKIQQICSQPLQAAFRAPLKSLWSAASISNALKITHGGTRIALDIGRKIQIFYGGGGGGGLSCWTNQSKADSHVVGKPHMRSPLRCDSVHFSQVCGFAKLQLSELPEEWRMIPMRIETQSQNLYVMLRFWFNCIHVLLKHGKIWQRITLNWNMSSGESCKFRGTQGRTTCNSSTPSVFSTYLDIRRTVSINWIGMQVDSNPKFQAKNIYL